jgi:DNA-binding response OmpR family regulator
MLQQKKSIDYLAKKRNKKILHVVTGNTALIRSLVRHLIPLNYEIYRENVELEKVAEIIKTSRCDMVIFETAVSGPNVIRDYLDIRLKTNMPVIMLSSRDCPDDMIRVFDPFVNGFFTEPFAIAEIGERLEILP